MDYSLFTYRNGDTFMALLGYLDDLVLMGSDDEACKKVKDIS